MKEHIIRLGCCLLPIVWLVPAALRAADDKEEGPALNDLSMEVSALQTLYQLQVTRGQMTELKKIAARTADKPVNRQASMGSAQLRRLFGELHAALVKADDDDKIAELHEKLDKLRDKEKLELDDQFELSEAAHVETPRALPLFTPRQLAFYAASIADELQDPLEQIQSAMAQVRALDDKKWKDYRGAVAEEVGRLLAGLDVEAAEEIGDRVVQLLIVVRSLNNEELKTRGPELDAKARAIVGEAGPLEVMRNVLEYHLAELLSNPRLTAALDARLK